MSKLRSLARTITRRRPPEPDTSEIPAVVLIPASTEDHGTCAECGRHLDANIGWHTALYGHEATPA